MKRKIVLFASLAAGVIAALLTRLYLNACADEVRAQKAAIERKYGVLEVLCFNRDVPGGTELVKGDIGLITVPKLAMRGQALTMENYSDVLGRKTLIGHRKGDVVFWSDIEGGDPQANGLAGDVKRLMRAVSINCSGAAAVSGMVKPNDHVDVIGTFNFDANDRKDPVTCTILQNVLVLATGKDTAKSVRRALGGVQGYSQVTLEVTPREAEMLVFAEQIKGRLTLALRNRNDTSYEKELPQVDYKKIREEIGELNLKRQQRLGAK